jgi:hypothetical protein
MESIPLMPHFALVWLYQKGYTQNMKNETMVLILVSLPILCFGVGFLVGFFTGLNVKKGGRQ